MECSGNGGRVYRREGNQTDLTPQQIDGLTSTSEWTGVPLATLLREAGASPKAHVVPRRRHGRRGDDAQHPDRQGAGTTR